jgi:hypothetical protein
LYENALYTNVLSQTSENTQTAHWNGLPALIWLSSYVGSHCLAMVPQSGSKQKNYCTVYYITLNSNCEAQGYLKI